MPITVPCIKCKTKFQVPSKFAGQKVRCQACGCVLRLPSPETIRAKKQAAAAGKSATPFRKAAVSAPVSSPVSAPAPSPVSEELDIVDFYDDAGEPSTATDTGLSAATQEPPVLSCSHCEGLLYYDPNFANQTVACPHCGNHLIMPEL